MRMVLPLDLILVDGPKERIKQYDVLEPFWVRRHSCRNTSCGPPYDEAALEPTSPGSHELHHGKHHKTRREGQRSAGQLDEVRDKKTSPVWPHWRSVGLHLSGHVLHSIFWRNLSPDGGDKPTGALLAAIKRTSALRRFNGQLTERRPP